MALATLPLVLCVLMVELAIGGAFLMWYIDRSEPAPSGFLKLTAFGGADAAMLLGHWYLVTPKLSSGPLQRAALVLVGAVALQIGLVSVAIARGELTLNMEMAFVIAAGLRVGVGLFMTLAVALAAWWTARMNTQASTGLLFVGLGCVLAGEVSARVLFFLTGAGV